MGKKIEYTRTKLRCINSMSLCYLSILANGATSNTGRNEVLQYDNSSSSLSRPRQQTDTYTDICEDGSKDSSSEEDEYTPLIPQKRPRYTIEPRRRYKSETICEYEIDFIQREVESTAATADKICCNRHSYPYDNLKDISLYSYNSDQNNGHGSGFIDFTLRTEPHNILKSFNIQDKSPIIKKVKEWDLKYRWSNTLQVTKPMSAFSFLTCHASNRPDILEQVQCWEMKDGTCI